ncbi:MAG: ATP-binding protein [Caulobacteraceae bacterium]|nr:ATP-binding protein [Caulobacteraceae bacterium]
MSPTKGPAPGERPPAAAVSEAYRPIVRGYLLATACYYLIIAASHPFYEHGRVLALFEGLALAACGVGLHFWWAFKKPVATWRLELAALTINALFMANVLAYELVHFEAAKLVYFVLMALVFGTSAPSLRVACVSTAAAIIGLVLMARRATEDFNGQYAFIGVAAVFAALGMATLMRGAIHRELSARLASDALNRDLELKLIEIERLRAQAQAADRAKSEFLATMSHEIRTPLNGVLGMVEIMDRAPLPPRQKERLTIIKSSARTLLQIINAVLDISKIEAGKMELVSAPFSLSDMTDALAQLYSGVASEKGLGFSLVKDPGLDDVRHGDEVRFRQVMSNLISNALKFTETGGVTVTVQGDASTLKVRVSDTGAGVPEAMRDYVFERFTQADGSNTRRSGGSGLGLAICRELVELMGGRIRLVPPGEQPLGACFEFEVAIPALADTPAPPQVQAHQASDLASDRDLKVLIVDDNATNRLVLSALLDELGVRAAFARDGVEAVEAFKAEPWDLILMDIHMPNMDGLEASRAIRACEQTENRPRTPIVAVTASALAHETEQYRAAGMDGCVPKPIDIHRLVTEIQAALAPSDLRAA